MIATSISTLLYPALLATLTANHNLTVFPDEHGVPFLVDLNVQLLSLKELAVLQANINQIHFELYTRKNPHGERLQLGNVAGLKSSNWNPNNPTRIVTHGWRGDSRVSSCTSILDAYIYAGDYNVIVVDWGSIAQNILYGKVVKSVPEVAKHVAKMLNFLRKEGGLDFSTTKIIGHSLGAHIAGLAAFYADGRIAEVVALDPAKPYYEKAGVNERVDAVHAEHVQVIHTNAGLLGLLEPIGTADFYPNEGKRQPGCSITDLIGACSHSRSYLYYAESIRNPTGFPSTLTSRRGRLIGNRVAYMGGPTLDHSALGSYNLKTKSQSPYATA